MREQILVSVFIVGWGAWFVWKASRDGRDIWTSPLYAVALLMFVLVALIWAL